MSPIKALSSYGDLSRLILQDAAELCDPLAASATSHHPEFVVKKWLTGLTVIRHDTSKVLAEDQTSCAGASTQKFSSARFIHLRLRCYEYALLTHTNRWRRQLRLRDFGSSECSRFTQGALRT